MTERRLTAILSATFLFLSAAVICFAIQDCTAKKPISPPTPSVGGMG